MRLAVYGFALQRLVLAESADPDLGAAVATGTPGEPEMFLSAFEPIQGMVTLSTAIAFLFIVLLNRGGGRNLEEVERQ